MAVLPSVPPDIVPACARHARLARAALSASGAQRHHAALVALLGYPEGTPVRIQANHGSGWLRVWVGTDEYASWDGRSSWPRFARA